MNLMLETKLPDLYPGTPVKYDGQKTWTVSNCYENYDKIVNMILLYHDP